ncbi:MAG: imidazole glycerol phosphate synthase subunit HisH [Marinifilaceae bacterium]
MSKNIAIINYGAGNCRSVINALQRLGHTAVVTDLPEQIKAADYVIFPGVGEARFAMNRLRAKGLDKLIPTLTQPVLGICLGMQLMCDYCEEGDTPALGIFPMRVERIVPCLPQIKSPHMGWNTISFIPNAMTTGVPADSYLYFVHSYAVPVSPYTVATTEYHAPFSAMLRRDNFWGCQFHPEKSGKVGELLLSNFLNQ